MTVASTTNRNDYTGTGSTDTYSYTYRIFLKTDLKVTIRDTNGNETLQTVDVDYTVTGVGEVSGGTIVLTAGNLATNYVLTIRRVRPLKQNTDIRNQGEFFPETHEDEFDSQVMIDQQQQDDIDRSVRNPETVATSVFDPTLPTDIATAEVYLRTNAAGDGFETVAGVTPSSITMPAGTGVLVKNSTTNSIVRDIDGTANEVTVTNGDGQSGNPTISLPSAITLPGTLSMTGKLDTSADIEMTGTGSLQLPSGTTAQRPGTPVNGDVRYNSTNDDVEAYQDSVWEKLVTPTGIVSAFAGTSAPTGYLMCDGAAVSRTTYARLFAVIGITHGQGDGSTTFNVPDYEGRFLRGVDNAAGRDPDAGSRTAMATGGNTGDNVGSVQADEYKSHDHPFRAFSNVTLGAGTRIVGRDDASLSDSGDMIGHRGGNETRPLNAYVNYIIKT